MAAYMDEEDEVGYADFAVTTAQQVVNEETDRLYDEFYVEIQELVQSLTARLSERIDARMKELGIAQELVIVATWDPKEMPVFNFRGATDIGVKRECD